MRTLVGVLLLLLVSTGCGNDEGGDGCTDIGAASGITLQLHRVLTPHPGAEFVVQTCLDSACTDHVLRGRAKGRAYDVSVGGAVSDGSPRVVGVTVTDESGRVVFDGRREVRPQEYEPNGPGCEPRVWVATLRAVGSRRLVVLPPVDASPVRGSAVSSAEVPGRVVDHAADRLMTFQEEAGFGRVRVHYGTGTVTVYWKGDPSEPVLQAVHDMDPRVTVTVRDVPFSADELVAAGVRILRASAAGRWDTQIVSTKPMPDLSGLTVEALEPSEVPLDDLQEVAGLPVELVQGEPLTDLTG